MNCPKCNAEVAENATACPACGEPVEMPVETSTVAEQPTMAEQLVTGQIENGARERQEEETWVAGPWQYSGKAMRGAFLGAGLFTLALITLGIALEVLGWRPASGGWHFALWAVLLLIPALVWLYLFGVYLYRRMTVRYSLTPYRFFHEEGLMIRRKHVIEVIDIDDIEHSQSLWERFVCGNVGTITIHSSDAGNPKLVIRGLENHDEVFQKIDEARRKQRQKRGLKAI
jgi:membrane protein YdbS with pleckstrin-like domain